VKSETLKRNHTGNAYEGVNDQIKKNRLTNQNANIVNTVTYIQYSLDYEQKLRCILCYVTYQMESMKSARLHRHYEQNIKKHIDFFIKNRHNTIINEKVCNFK
jgi:hypothetical protein